MAKSLFMIHGMWNGPQYWRKFKNYFDELGFHCHTPVLRFHDMIPTQKPDPSLGTTSVQDYANDLEQEINTLSEKPIIMGHSMGGLLAQILASRGCAKLLVLLTPTPPSGIAVFKPSIICNAIRLKCVTLNKKKHVRPSFKAASQILLNQMQTSEHRAIYDKFVFESGRAVNEITSWFFDKNNATRVEGSQVTCPVLTIAGGKDKINQPSLIRCINDKYKSVSTYKEFPDNGHWIIAEPNWKEVADYIVNWINRKLVEI